jgi:hypothetical protein
MAIAAVLPGERFGNRWEGTRCNRPSFGGQARPSFSRWRGTRFKTGGDHNMAAKKKAPKKKPSKKTTIKKKGK